LLAELEEPRDFGCWRAFGVEARTHRAQRHARLIENRAQRPVDAVAVRKAASEERGDAFRAARELCGKTRLADAGRPHSDGDTHRGAVYGELEGTAQRGELSLPTYEWSVEATPERRSMLGELGQTPSVTFRFQPSCVRQAPGGRLADQHLAVCGALSQERRGTNWRS
jgi:hypothetical protein